MFRPVALRPASAMAAAAGASISSWATRLAPTCDLADSLARRPYLTVLSAMPAPDHAQGAETQDTMLWLLCM